MPDENKDERYVHLESGFPIFTPPLEDPDPHKSADREAEKAYKDEQLTLQRKLFWTQIAIVVLTLVGGGASCYSTWVAQQAADTSDRTVVLAQKSGRDARLASEKQLMQSQLQFDETLKQMKAQTSSQEGAVRAANDGVKVTHEQMRLDQRAWISIDATASGPLWLDEGGGRLEINVSLKNFGHSPAQSVRFQSIMLFEDYPPERYCGGDFAEHPERHFVGKEFTIFPGQDQGIHHAATATRYDVSGALEKMYPVRSVLVTVLTCVDYTLAFDPSIHHQTQQAYSVSWDKEGWTGTTVFRPNGSKYGPIYLVPETGFSN